MLITMSPNMIVVFEVALGICGCGHVPITA